MRMRWWNARRTAIDAQLNAAEARDELLSSYLDDELGAAESAALGAQLAADRGLRAAVDELREVRAALQSLPEYRAPRSFAVTAPPSSARRSRLELGVGVGAVAAAVGFVLVLGADLSSGGSRSVALSETTSLVASDVPNREAGADREAAVKADDVATGSDAQSGTAAAAASATSIAPASTGGAAPAATTFAATPPAVVTPSQPAAGVRTPAASPPPARSTTTSALEATAGAAASGAAPAAPAAAPPLQAATSTPTASATKTATPSPTLTVTPIVSIRPAVEPTEGAAPSSSGSQLPATPIAGAGSGAGDAARTPVAPAESGSSGAVTKPFVGQGDAQVPVAPVLREESLLASRAGNDMRISVRQESGLDRARAAEVGLGALALGLTAATVSLWYVRRRQAAI